MAKIDIVSVTFVDRYRTNISVTVADNAFVSWLKKLDKWSAYAKEWDNPGVSAPTVKPALIEAYSDNTGATITWHPEFPPNIDFVFSLETDVASTLDATVPDAAFPTKGESEFPKKFLEVFSTAAGNQIGFVSGRPETILLKDFDWRMFGFIDDYYGWAYCETTLGFNYSGHLFIDGTLFTYASKWDGGFVDVRPARLDDPASIGDQSVLNSGVSREPGASQLVRPIIPVYSRVVQAMYPLGPAGESKVLAYDGKIYDELKLS